ncbi:MAG TPA: HNH endonuclease [Anaeromyxobacteraceae bacterium]|nr:HNH endonuclease [Anaeromyxobacteraceae bacterium]
MADARPAPAEIADARPAPPEIAGAQPAPSASAAALPVPFAATPLAVPIAQVASSPESIFRSRPEGIGASGSESTESSSLLPVAQADSPLRASSRARPELRPLSEESYSLRLTLDAAFKGELDQLRQLLSHKVPSGDLAAVLREAVRCAIDKHGKRRGAVAPASKSASPSRRAAARPAVTATGADSDAQATAFGAVGETGAGEHAEVGSPETAAIGLAASTVDLPGLGAAAEASTAATGVLANAAGTGAISSTAGTGAVANLANGCAPAKPDHQRSKPRSRPAIPAAVRREVWARDGGRCTWCGEGGRRCESRWQLELDHVVPVALGGPTTAANLRLACRAHNGFHAEQVFGREHMARFRRGATRQGETTIASGDGR